MRLVMPAIFRRLFISLRPNFLPHAVVGASPVVLPTPPSHPLTASKRDSRTPADSFQPGISRQGKYTCLLSRKWLHCALRLYLLLPSPFPLCRKSRRFKVPPSRPR